MVAGQTVGASSTVAGQAAEVALLATAGGGEVVVLVAGAGAWRSADESSIVPAGDAVVRTGA